MSAHALLAGAIRELVPSSWRVIDHERATDEPDDDVPATVTIKLDAVSRPAEAPDAGVYVVAWTVTIATPHLDPELADPAVFDALLELVAALDGIPWLRWTTAQKVLVSGRYGFDINLDTLTERKAS